MHVADGERPKAAAAAAAAAVAERVPFRLVPLDAALGGAPGSAASYLALIAPAGRPRARRGLVRAALLAAARAARAPRVATGETAARSAASALAAAAAGAGAATALAAARLDGSHGGVSFARPLAHAAARDAAAAAALARWGSDQIAPPPPPPPAGAPRDATSLTTTFVAAATARVGSTAGSVVGALARVAPPAVDPARGRCALCGVPLVASDLITPPLPACYPCATLGLRAAPALGGAPPAVDAGAAAAVAAALPAGGLWEVKWEQAADDGP